MNRHPVEGGSSDAKGKTRKVAGKAETVMADINSDAEKDTKLGTEEHAGKDNKKHEKEDGAVLGKINSDTEKKKE